MDFYETYKEHILLMHAETIGSLNFNIRMHLAAHIYACLAPLWHKISNRLNAFYKNTKTRSKDEAYSIAWGLHKI